MVEGAALLEKRIINDTFKGDETLAWKVMHAWHRHAIYKGLAKETKLSFLGMYNYVSDKV